MAYRRIELMDDDLTLDAVKQALGEYEVIDLFLTKREDDLFLATMIVDESITEPTIDALQDAYGKGEHFQLLVYDIAARLPREEDEQQEQSSKDESGFRSERISREELLNDLEPGSRVRWIYVTQVVISCIVAAVGMIRDSVALVIAAMVIAPLLIPSMSLALATTIGDLKMVLRSVLTSAVGIATGLGLSLLIGLIVPFNTGTEQLISRAQVRYSDVIIALAAGAAGALSVTTGVSASLIGVMVAVALVPPLVAAGLFLGQGDLAAASAASILLATNVVCVNLAAVGVFLVQGIRPNRWAEQDRAKLAVRHALVIWVVLLAALFLLIAYAAPENPLR